MDPELLDGASVLPFLAAEHTVSVNSLPTTFGQVNADGMFPAEGMDTEYVKLYLEGGVLRALPVTDGGRPSSIARHEQGEFRIFEIPNISHEDSILAVDVRKWAAIMKRSRQPEQTLAELVENRHRKNRLKFDVTLEVMKMGALKGLITDGDNKTLYNLFDIFGVTEKHVYFDLSNNAADIVAKLEEVAGYIEDNLGNEVMDGVEARVSPEFFNALINHPNFQKFYLQTPAAQQLLVQARQQVAGQYRRTFQAGPIELREYRSKFTTWGGQSTRLIAAGEGHASPSGTQDTHHTYVAPPLDIRELDGSVAEIGDLIHVTTELMKHGAGEEWKYQANALPIWARPKTLVHLHSTAS